MVLLSVAGLVAAAWLIFLPDWGPAPAVTKTLPVIDVDRTTASSAQSNPVLGTEESGGVAAYQQALDNMLSQQEGVAFTGLVPDAATELLRGQKLPNRARLLEERLTAFFEADDDNVFDIDAWRSGSSSGPALVTVEHEPCAAVNPLRDILQTSRSWHAAGLMFGIISRVPLYAFVSAFVLEARRDAAMQRAAGRRAASASAASTADAGAVPSAAPAHADVAASSQASAQSELLSTTGSETPSESIAAAGAAREWTAQARGPRDCTIAALDALGIVGPGGAGRHATAAAATPIAEPAAAAPVAPAPSFGTARHGDLWRYLKRKQAVQARVRKHISAWLSRAHEQAGYEVLYKILSTLGLGNMLSDISQPEWDLIQQEVHEEAVDAFYDEVLPLSVQTVPYDDIESISLARPHATWPQTFASCQFELKRELLQKRSPLLGFEVRLQSVASERIHVTLHVRLVTELAASG